MLKKSKILVLLFICGVCCVSYAARCKCCGARVSERGIYNVIKNRFHEDWSWAAQHYSKNVKDFGDICFLKHIYAYGYKEIDEKLQVKYLKEAAEKAFVRKVQHINPRFFVIVEEYSLYEDVLKKFKSNEPCRKKYKDDCREHTEKIFTSLRKDYKIKGKDGKEILVSAVQTSNGYIAILDPETAWQHFYIPSKYKEYKNMNWIVFHTHPCDEFQLIPEEKYDEYIYAEKWDVFKEICQSLGAKKIDVQYAVKNGEKRYVHVSGEACSVWASAKASFETSKEGEKEIKAQNVTIFTGNSEFDDPCEGTYGSYLKKWIEQDQFFKSLYNRRMNRKNLSVKEKATFSYQSIDKFSLDASAEVKVLWFVTLKTNVKSIKEDSCKLEWSLEIEFPEPTSEKKAASVQTEDENSSEKNNVKEKSFWENLFAWF